MESLSRRCGRLLCSGTNGELGQQWRDDRLICGSVEGELGGQQRLDQLFCDVSKGELLVLLRVCICAVLSLIAVLGRVATDVLNTFQGSCLSIWSHYKSCCRNYFLFATDWC